MAHLALRGFDDSDFFPHFGLPLGFTSSGSDNTYNRGIPLDIKEVGSSPPRSDPACPLSKGRLHDKLLLLIMHCTLNVVIAIFFRMQR